MEINISDEQKKIIDDIENYNLLVDAVAGSGKSTTALGIANKYIDKTIMLITYNTKLRHETIQKVKSYHLENMIVHTYHSLCREFYDDTTTDDNGIISTTELNKKPIKKIDFDILILDEIQDMKELFFDLIIKFIYDNKKHIKIGLFGDYRQSIYQFNDADERYIHEGIQIFNTEYNRYEWKRLNLSTSYRLTDNIANFVNESLYQKKIIDTNSKTINPKVKYFITNLYDIKNDYHPVNEVKNYIEKMNYLFNDIFILVPSVNSYKFIANSLTKMEYPIYITTNNEKIDEDVVNNKILISTYHQSKGLERKIVILLGFDDSYFKFYKKNVDTNKCPNELYVAVTRAKEYLSIYHNENFSKLSFLNIDFKDYFLELYGEEKSNIKKNIDKNEDNIHYSTTELTKFLPTLFKKKLLKNVQIINILKADTKIKKTKVRSKMKQSKIANNEIYENHSEITGIAVVSYFEYINTNHMTILNNELSLIKREKKIRWGKFDIKKEWKMIEKKMKEEKKIDPSGLLYLSNLYLAERDNLNYKINQIKKYSWLTLKKLEECYLKMKKYIINYNNILFEKNIGCIIIKEKENKKITISGSLDCLEGNHIWEFKCVHQLRDEYILQLTIYMYLYYKNIFHPIYLKRRLYEIDTLNIEIEYEYDKNINWKIGDKVYFYKEYDFFDEGNEYCKRTLNNEYIECGDILYSDDENITVLIQYLNKKIPYTFERKKMILSKNIEKLELLKRKVNQYFPKFYLFLIFTEEIIELKSKIKDLEEMIEKILLYKKGNYEKINNGDFIQIHLDKIIKYKN